MINGLFELGDLHYGEGDLNKALSYFLEISRVIEKGAAPYKEQFAQIDLHIAYMYYSMGDFD